MAEIRELVAAIKDHLSKAAKSEKTAEQHFISAGMQLKVLKASKGKTPWYEYVKKTFKMSRERADELIRMADGKVTLDQSRATRRASMAKSKAKKNNGLGAKPGANGTRSGLRADEFRNAKGTVKSTCDYDPEDPDDVADPGDTPEQTRRQIFLNMVNEAKRLTEVLDERFFEMAMAKEATAELAAATKSTVAAWTKVAEKLKKLKGDRSEESKNEAPVRPVVH